MRCPFCEYGDSQVKDSRPSDDGFTVKRRRFCPQCNGRFTTYEKIEIKELVVVKRRGEKRLFDPQKLLRSLQVATRKRPVELVALEAIVSKITTFLEKSEENEVTSAQIGLLAMQELAFIDQVAYVRYASVYHDFHEANDFGKFIQNISNKKYG